jgi:hypothetical protein
MDFDLARGRVDVRDLQPAMLVEHRASDAQLDGFVEVSCADHRISVQGVGGDFGTGQPRFYFYAAEAQFAALVSTLQPSNLIRCVASIVVTFHAFTPNLLNPLSGFPRK